MTTLPSLKSPCTSVVSSPDGTCSGIHAIRRSIASIFSVSEARYCSVHRWIWRAK